MKDLYETLVGIVIALTPTGLAVLASAQLSKRSVEEWRLLAWVPSAPLVLFWAVVVIYMLRHPTANVL